MRVGSFAVDMFDATHQATEVKSIPRWVREAMFKVQHADCGKIEFN